MSPRAVEPSDETAALARLQLHERPRAQSTPLGCAWILSHIRQCTSMCIFSRLHQQAIPPSLPSPLPVPWGIILKLGQLIALPWPLDDQVKSHVSHFKLSEEGMAKANTGQKLGLLCPQNEPNSDSSCEYKGNNFEIKSATPATTGMIRKQNSLVADTERVLVVWIEVQPATRRSLKPKSNPESGPNCLQFCEGREK